MSFLPKYQIVARYLTAKSKRRSGLLITPKVKFIVAHDTGNPGATAAANVAYYERSRDEQSASAHLFVDDKEILECIPATTASAEKAWHVLYSVPTDDQLFGADANDAAIGVEYCYGGQINPDEAYRKYVWVLAYLCYFFRLDPAKSVVGHFFLDPQRRTDPLSGLAWSRHSYEQLLRDVVSEHALCTGQSQLPAWQEEPQQGQVQATAWLNLRNSAPNRLAGLAQTVPAGTVLHYQMVVRNGEAVNGNTVWYRNAAGHYFWSGATVPVAAEPAVDAAGQPPERGGQAAPAPISPPAIAELAGIVASSGPADDDVKAALGITGRFESSGDPYAGVSGDFDGMGLSLGVLQWNIGSASLQPLVQNAGQELVMQQMPVYGAQFWQACQQPVQEGLDIVRQWQTGNRLRADAKRELQQLAGSAGFMMQQIEAARVVARRAWQAAAEWNQSAGRGAPDCHLFCWFFDVWTQNGGMKGVEYADVAGFLRQSGSSGVDMICQWMTQQPKQVTGAADAGKNAELWRQHGNINPQTELLVASYLRSARSQPRWRLDVMNRKGCIAMREGYVHGKLYSI